MKDFTVKTWDTVANTLVVKKSGKRVANIYTRCNAVTVVTRVANDNSVELHKADHGFTFKTVFEYGNDEPALLKAILSILK